MTDMNNAEKINWKLISNSSYLNQFLNLIAS